MHPKPKRDFEKRKIVTPNLSTENNFALDENNNFYLDHDCYGIILKNREDLDYIYILSLLNSKVLEFYIKQISPYASGKYFRYMTGYLEQLPIKLPETLEEKTIADEINRNVKGIFEMVNLKQRINTFPRDYIKEFRKRGEEFESRRINFKSNHKNLSPAIEKTMNQGYNLILAKKEEKVAVNSFEKAEYLSNVLDGKKIKKGDKVDILVPKNNYIVKEILDNYKNDLKNFKGNEIDKLESEIDRLVYNLYGLNKREKQIIEDYLNKL